MANLDQLQAFVVAADEGSFSAAARLLGKAQSAISTSVINLEIDSGVELFDRSGRSPVLTKSGNALLKYARSVLRGAEEFHAQANSISGGIEAKLGIAIEQGIFVHSLMDLFTDLGQRFPRLEVELFDPGPIEVAELLKAGRADIGIMIEQESYPRGFHFRGIGHSQQIPVCNCDYPLAKAAQVSYLDLCQYRQLITRSLLLENDDYLRGQKSPNIWIGESPYLIMDYVLSGLGWSELPWTVVSEKLASGELVRLNYDFQQSRILHGIDLVWTEQRALGTSGLWLMSNLLELNPELWTE
ncbi:MAG: LysR family transcriptional regulator [Gammaproteobacteria bacterium]|nr:LysR family transcriptional regulator [Gammaproteobacteria bacterium]